MQGCRLGSKAAQGHCSGPLIRKGQRPCSTVERFTGLASCPSEAVALAPQLPGLSDQSSWLGESGGYSPQLGVVAAVICFPAQEGHRMCSLAARYLCSDSEHCLVTDITKYVIGHDLRDSCCMLHPHLHPYLIPSGLGLQIPLVISIRQDPVGPPEMSPSMVGEVDVHFGFFFTTREHTDAEGSSRYKSILVWGRGDVVKVKPLLLPF